MLCCAMLSYATLGFAVLCDAVLCYAMDHLRKLVRTHVILTTGAYWGGPDSGQITPDPANPVKGT
eukprot:6788250-Karenia_brevis.AAC.1